MQCYWRSTAKAGRLDPRSIIIGDSSITQTSSTLSFLHSITISQRQQQQPSTCHLRPSCFKFNNSSLRSQATLANADFENFGIDASELNTLIVGKCVHCLQSYLQFRTQSVSSRRFCGALLTFRPVAVWSIPKTNIDLLL